VSDELASAVLRTFRAGHLRGPGPLVVACVVVLMACGESDLGAMTERASIGTTCACDAVSEFVCRASGTVISHGQCPSGSHCTETEQGPACVGASCSSGSIHCASRDAVATCNATGSGYDITPCGPGRGCIDGACVPASTCDPHASRCDDGVRQVCDADGSAWRDVPCDDDPVCEVVASGCACDAGECVPRWCEPGATRCSGDGVVTCVDGFAESSPDACADGETCLAGACVPDVCESGASSCVGDRVLGCTDDGASPRVVADCAALGSTCVDDGAGARCATPDCDAGTTRCVDAATEQACVDGAWADAVPCADGTACEAGGCRSAALGTGCDESGSTLCVGGDLLVCWGDAWILHTACGDQVCADGACRDAVCAPGEAWCDGRALHHCDEHGARFDRFDCDALGAVCDADAGSCVRDVCADATGPVCDGAAVVTCTDGARDGAGEPCGPLGCADGVCVTAPRPHLATCSADAGCESGRCSNARCVAPGEVWIPPGTYEIGWPESGVEPDDVATISPPHPVVFERGRIMRATVTTVAESLVPEPLTGPAGGCIDADGQCPMDAGAVCMAWEHAARASVADGFEDCYDFVFDGVRVQDDCLSAGVLSRRFILDGAPGDCDGWRVPTEAEWLVAHRAGAPVAAIDARGPAVCHGARDVAPTAWSACDGVPVQPVGRRAPNAWGLYDMPGNVREVVIDGAREYTPVGATEPLGFAARPPGAWIIGCSVADRIEGCRLSTRAVELETFDDVPIGFRLIRTVDPESLP